MGSLRCRHTCGAIGWTPYRRSQATALAAGTATRVARLGREAVAGSGLSHGLALGLSRSRSPVAAGLRAKFRPAAEFIFL
jgi:hypothetical protein